jgi:uncharacterized protein YyaL (SSP411 family)
MFDPALLKISLFDLIDFRDPYNSDIPLTNRIVHAVDWITQAYLAPGDGGISKGYDLLRGCWSPSYPETTGYTIPTLLNVAYVFERQDLQATALSLAEYLLDCVTLEGGVVHWQDSSSSYPIVFDTGQVIFGWLAASDWTDDERFLLAASKAGNWLVSIQHSTGSWQKNQYLKVEKVIDARVSWALLELYRRTGRESYLTAAVRNLNWVLDHQHPDGWFDQCSFKQNGPAITHTLAYTSEGLFECGVILDDESYIEAAQLTADAILALQRANGSLASTYGRGWKQLNRSSCLTGNCQMGHLWLRFFEITGNQRYLEAARKSIVFVASTQKLNTANAGIRGAIAGSYPIFGNYERFKYPNWAAKFFIDSLLALEKAETGYFKLPYRG